MPPQVSSKTRRHAIRSSPQQVEIVTNEFPTGTLSRSQAVSDWYRSGVRCESLGARSPVVGFHVVGVQAVEEFRDCPLGSEHVKGHMLPVLRNNLVFALRF